MRKSFTTFLGILTLIAVAGCFADWSPNSIKGSGVAKTEARAVDTFTKIRVDSSADIQLLIGDKPELTIETDDNLLPLVETSVQDGVLRIKSSESYTTRMGVKVRIVTASLKAIDINGSATLRAADLKEPTFAISIRGSGDVKLKGAADALDVSIAGSGDVDTRDLASKSVKVVISGSGAAVVNASDVVDAQINGSGDVKYVGNPPTVRKNVRGVGSIKSIDKK